MIESLSATSEETLTTQQLFFPDKTLVFRSLPEQFMVIHEMRWRYENLRKEGYSSHEAFYYAFVLTHPNKHGVSTPMGADDFYVRMTRLLSAAQDMVEQVIERYLRPFLERLAFHNTVANCLDPIQMLELATNDPGAGASHLDRRRHFEAARQLGIALQLFSIDSVDSEGWVAEDMGTIERLSWERLFVQGESKDIWILAQINLNSQACGRANNLYAFVSSKDKNRMYESLRKRKILIREELLSCRVTLIGSTRFYVLAINRRKRLLSTLTKLERGRPFTDRRGWKYVVVAVQTDRELRLATRNDAELFHEHTKVTLWKEPLCQEEDASPPNPNRHASYWDLKVVGRFHHMDNGRIVAGSAEQLVTTVCDYLDTAISTNFVNHFLYRAKQIFEYLVPLWFPHKRESYEGTTNFRLPGYGVDWEKDHFRFQLEKWWKSQL